VSDNIDGRRRRAERSRSAVVDAVLALFDDGILEPAASDIAARAGVSERSVFRHFADLEALAAEALDRQFARVATFFEDPSTEGTLTERIDAFVDGRCRLYERMANLARAANHVGARSATIAAAVGERRRVLRSQVDRQFEPELARRSMRERRLLLAALDACSSFEGLDHLRTVGGIGPRDLKVVLAQQLTALLSHPPRSTS
jgi:AcrR family transcriptional regulator